MMRSEQEVERARDYVKGLVTRIHPVPDDLNTKRGLELIEDCIDVLSWVLGEDAHFAKKLRAIHLTKEGQIKDAC